MNIPLHIWARDYINRLLFDVIPTEIRHSVKLHPIRTDIVEVQIHDGAPLTCPVRAAKFIAYLENRKPSYEQLVADFKRNLNIRDNDDLFDEAARRESLSLKTTLNQLTKHD